MNPSTSTNQNAQPLTTTTIDELKTYFAQVNHRPSQTQWTALTALTATLERMANSQAVPKIYLCSLDPGVGKTCTVRAFVSALLLSPQHDHVGVMICVGRLDEVRKYAEMIRGSVGPQCLAVKTSDESLNALGDADVDDAKVLITTQQGLEKSLKNRSFAESPWYTYRGKPRLVRIWDETYLPGVPLTVNRDDLAFLFKPLRPVYEKLTDELEALFHRLKDVPDGSTYHLPDFAGDCGVELNEVLRLFEDPRDPADSRLKEDQRSAVSALWLLSGKMATVRRDGLSGSTILDYQDTLPEDLAPMVVLDASGRVRETYVDLETHRKSLVRLPTAVKRYDPLTVHVWRRSGAKSGFRRHGEELVEGIASTILQKPEEPWLVVCHKRSNRAGYMERDLLRRLDDRAKNVSFLHWGAHMATNAFVDVPNVVLAGTLFYRPSYYDALKRVAAGRPSSQGAVTPAELARVVAGEHAHLVLQALCRGSVRKCDGEYCGRMNAYVIASVRSGIPAALPRIFPGCTVTEWRAVRRDPRGRVREALKEIDEWRQSPLSSEPLRFGYLANQLGMDPRDFHRDVRHHPVFVQELAERGVIEWGAGKRFTAFRLVEPPAPTKRPTVFAHPASEADF